MQDKPDQFHPIPEIMCPISGEIIRVWMYHTDEQSENPYQSGKIYREINEKGAHHQDRWLQNQKKAKDAEIELEDHEFDEDFRIVAYSPAAGHENIRVIAHCFVKEGKWTSTEICHVSDIESGQVFYNTDEESEEDILRRIIEEKKAQQ